MLSVHLHRHFTLGSAAALLLLTAAPSFGQAINVHEPPPELSFLTPLVKFRPDQLFELWDEARFPRRGEAQTPKRGKYWPRVLGLIPNGKDMESSWNLLKPAFLKNGWTGVQSFRHGGFLETMKYSQNGVEAWVNIELDAAVPTNLEVEVVEVSPIPISMTLPAPAPEPEKMAPDKGDFPYLPPLPGSKFHSGRVQPDPFLVTPNGATRGEAVASGIMIRNYSLPALSNLLFVTAYKQALVKAGWTIVEEGKADLTAHYVAKSRNLWAQVGLGGDGYSIIVGDAGKTDLGSTLAKTCHVALYGVLFDFNKSTLQPASDGVLQQVTALLAADKGLKVEVQGHTDNVGNDAYNQTLSEARAESVRTWLVQHGTAAERLTAKGYGKTKPVADNGNDEGRAKNRRVEIADPRCTPKG